MKKYGVLSTTLLLVTLASPLAARERAAGPRRGDAVDTERYIVILKREAVRSAAEPTAPGMTVRDLASDLALVYGGRLEQVYEHALQGGAIRLTEAQAKALAADRRVARIERDQELEAFATQVGPLLWQLDRIDERDLPRANRFTYTSDGAGVNIYILDTGVAANSTEFGNRLINTYSNAGGAFGDPAGHGTNVAIMAAGAVSGVAKGAKIRAVRIKSQACSTSGGGGQPEFPALAGTCFYLSDVLDAVNWVTGNRIKPAVANLSLGGSATQSLDDAVTALNNAGVTVVAAAGNKNVTACNVSPARVSTVLTVGATDYLDGRAFYDGGGASNFGSCVNIFAPGKDNLVNGQGAVSGTSFAAPLAAGVAAQYLKNNPTATPANVRNYILNNATNGRLTNLGSGSPNKLLFAPPGGFETDNPPVPKFTFTCSGRTCTFNSQSTDDFAISACFWTWGYGYDVGGGCTNVVHTFPYAGSFTVRHTPMDDGLQTAFIEKVVTVN